MLSIINQFPGYGKQTPQLLRYSGSAAQWIPSFAQAPPRGPSLTQPDGFDRFACDPPTRFAFPQSLSQMNASTALVQAIHASNVKLALVITGGGSRAIADLLETPGGSRSLVEACVPYASQSLNAYLGAPPEEYCSARTARALGMAAFERALRLVGKVPSFDPHALAGVACTASLVSDREKRGPHRVHVAMQTSRVTMVWSLELRKGERTRAEEEAVAAQMILQAVAEAARVTADSVPALLPGEVIEVARKEAPEAWSALLLGERAKIRARGETDASVEPTIFPGAFNPPHAGHARMVAFAERMLGGCVALEISIENVDKPPLDFLEIEQRLAQLGTRPVWLTRAATFLEKSELFPGAAFLVGADTIERIANPKYYGGDAARSAAAIETLAARGCRFIVFGRTLPNRGFVTLSTLELPPQLTALCREVPESEFHEDISSTELRSHDLE